MNKLKQFFFHLFSLVDQHLKFPGLKKGEIGIQVGFDMYSPLTSDLFEMSRKVGKKGLVIGIDPDERNHSAAREIMQQRNCTNIKLMQYGTYSEVAEASLLLGRRTSWSQIGNFPVDVADAFSGNEKEIQLITLDHLLKDQDIDIQQIGHVNITNNGAEYDTLLGFGMGLSTINDLSLTVIAGRYDSSGIIDGTPDYELIMEYLKSMGFKTMFRRVHQLIWWGFFVRLLINRSWIYNKKNYGVVFAAKGKKRIPFYQSFS